MNKRTRRSHKGMIALIVLLVIIVFLLEGLSMSRLDNLTIKNSTYYNDKKFCSLYGIKPGRDNTFITYVRLKYGKHRAVPFIEDLDYDITDAHSLTIEVFEKKIIGCIPYMGEYICFDKDGVMVGSITRQRKDIPVVSGIKYSNMIYNSKVDTKQDNIFTTVLNITQLIDKYDIQAEKIAFDSNMNVTLTCGTITVELGDGSHFDNQISNLGSILEKAKGLKGILHMENYAMSDGRVVFEKK